MTWMQSCFKPGMLYFFIMILFYFNQILICAEMKPKASSFKISFQFQLHFIYTAPKLSQDTLQNSKPRNTPSKQLGSGEWFSAGCSEVAALLCGKSPDLESWLSAWDLAPGCPQTCNGSEPTVIQPWLSFAVPRQLSKTKSKFSGAAVSLGRIVT